MFIERTSKFYAMNKFAFNIILDNIDQKDIDQKDKPKFEIKNKLPKSIQMFFSFFSIEQKKKF